MSERLRLLGLLEEKKQELLRLRLKNEGLRELIRNHLPLHQDVEHINGPSVVSEALELGVTLQMYKDLLEEVSAIKRDLGI